LPSSKNSSRKRTLKAASLNEIRDEWARRQLLAFTERTFPEYRPGWFHRAVAEKLDQFVADIAAKRSPRLILTAPPQHGKSELVSRRLPAYALGKNPDLKIIATSYSADRSFDFSNDVQKIMDTATYHAIFSDTRIVGEYAKAGEARSAAGLFQVVGHRGRYRAAGVGGGITGEPADLLIIDDPIKDFAESISETVRESVWNWLTSTALTRLQEGAGVIIMATRWHLDDPIGRLLERQRDQWELVNFQAIAEEDEPPYRVAGEPLSPERYSLESLVAIRDGGAVSSYQWSALYQQRPSPLGGGIFKREDWCFYKERPATFEEIIESWDCSFKDTSSSDYVVGQVWGVRGADRFLLDQVRGRMRFSATLAAIRALSAKWPQAHAKLVEDKANGSAVIDTLRHEVPGLIAVNPEGGKEARAHAVSASVEAHNVYLPDPVLHPWVSGFIEECASFPNAKFDDQVDAMTQGLSRLQTKRLVLGLTDLINEAAAERNVRPASGSARVIQFIEANSGCPECQSNRFVKSDSLGMFWRCNSCRFEWRGPQPTGGHEPPTLKPSPAVGTPQGTGGAAGAILQHHDNSDVCPECQYHGIARRGPTLRCSKCGYTWKAPDKPVARPPSDPLQPVREAAARIQQAAIPRENRPR